MQPARPLPSGNLSRSDLSLSTLFRVAAGLRPRTGREIFILLFTAVVGAWLLLKPAGGRAFLAVSDSATVLGPIIGACWCFAAWWRSGRRLGSVLFVGLGIFAYAVGDAIWGYYEVILGREGPFPSWADAAYLSSYPLLLTGIMMVPRRRISGTVRSRVVLDGMLAMSALATMSWYFLLGPTVLNGQESPLGKLLGGFYPVGDLLLLFCLLVLMARSGEQGTGRMTALVSCGLIGVVAADTAFGYLTLHGTYPSGCLADLGWVLGYMLIGLGASDIPVSSEYVTRAPEADSVVAGNGGALLWKSMAPYALVPAVGVLLFYARCVPGDDALESGVYTGCTVVIGLLLLRQVLSMLDNSRLQAELHTAYAELVDQNRRLAALATTDAMTGLANHGTFQKRLSAEMERAHGGARASALLLLDIDEFKSLNDGSGHLHGDQVIKIVAELVWTCVGDHGFAARYGGDEFAVLLPEVGHETARAIAEQIRSEVSCYAFPQGPVTASIGVAFTGPDSLTAAEVITHADLALYAAKNSGRNCVVTWDELNDVSGAILARTASRAVALPRDRESDHEGSLTFTADGGDARFLEAVFRGPEAQILLGVLSALDMRDRESEGHSQRVARFALRLAQEVARQRLACLTETELHALALGALLHDIGKIGVPDTILLKNGPLTEEEWEVVRQHPAKGAALLCKFPSLSSALPIVRHHHERWDGQGYPDGLRGREIPLAARIFAFADTLDAMTSDRPYRNKLPYHAVREEVARMSGSQFDPHLVAAFMSVPEHEWQQMRELPLYSHTLDSEGDHLSLAA
jgi:diguanylate cyclase (GGDEF)-like protein